MKTVLFFNRSSIASILFLFLSLEAISQTFTIQGRILDADTQEYIEGATITLRNTQFGDQSGGAGNFSIKGITEEKYTLAVTMSGYNLFEKVKHTELFEVLSLWQQAFEWSFYDEVPIEVLLPLE